MKKDRPNSPPKAPAMAQGPQEAPPRRLRVSALATDKPTTFDFQPDAAERAEIAGRLGLKKLRKLRFQGRIEAEGKTDWRLEAMLGATVVQPCVVSLAPVTTRIDEPVTRHYLKELADREADLAATDTGEEGIEIPEDVTAEPLGHDIDLWEVMIESLALALPLYPRQSEARLEEGGFALPGDEGEGVREESPFASLAALRGKLDGTGSGGEGGEGGNG